MAQKFRATGHRGDSLNNNTIIFSAPVQENLQISILNSCSYDPEPQRIHLDPWFSQKLFCLPRDVWQCLKIFLIVTLEVGGLLACSG